MCNKVMNGRFILFFSLLVLLLFVKNLDAYDCEGPGPPKKELRRADYVFTGKVIRHEFADPRDTIFKIRYYFEVNRMWKGEKKKIIAVTANRFAECGTWFQDGVEYIVYAYKQKWQPDADSTLMTGFGRSAPLSQAQEDLKELGTGEEIK